MIGVAWAIPVEHMEDDFDLSEYMVLPNIARRICADYNVPYKQLIGDRRQANLVRARHHFLYLASTETTRSLSQIGKFCGNRDHSSVIYGIQKHKERMGL